MPFPTCQEAYNRVRWDPALDPAAYTIGYATRAGAIKEKPLLSWDPEGDIPWHRVRYLRAGETIMWDREARIDLIVRPPQAANKDAPQEAAPTQLASHLPWRFIQGRWAAQQLDAAPAPARLRLLTQNALFDTFDADKLDTPARTNALLAALQHADADLIALQEVTPDLLAALLATPWLRERYAASASPDAHHAVSPHGQLLLSRLPFTWDTHTFSPQKRLLLTTVTPSNTPPITIAVAHLTSSRAPDGPAKRAAQLDTTLALTRQHPHVLLVGDMNLRDGECAQALTQHDMLDVWPALRPEEAGYTYDPDNNPLARLLSASGQPARYDRVLLRSEHSLLSPSAIDLVGIPDAGQKPLSDHWGLLATLDLQTARAGRPTVTSALAILPPAHALHAIQTIRAEHDPSFDRWMPHINLLYPFVPAEDFDAAAQQLAAACADLAPFPATLAGLDQFEHRTSRSIWLKPASSNKIEALRAQLLALFPQCDDPEARGQHAFTPHLTLAKVPGDAPWRQLMQRWQAELEPLRFPVTHLALLARHGDAPFSVRHLIPLGPQTSLASQLDACPDAQHAPDPSHALAQLRRIAGPQAHLHLFGSHALGVATAHSDLDLVMVSPEPSRDALARVAAALKHAPGASHVTLATEATVPVLRAQLHGQRLDLLHAQCAPDTPPERADLARLAAPDDASRRALDGVLGADWIINRLCDADALDQAQLALRWLKTWAKRRGLSGTAWGLWGGFSWALLTTHAASALHAARHMPTPEAIAQLALHTLAHHPWPAPLALHPHDPSSRRARADHMPLLHPLSPHENTTRSMIASTASLLRAEARAALRDGLPDWSLASPPEPSGERVELTLAAQDRGWLERRVVALLLKLEQLGAADLRPHPEGEHDGDTLTIAITLALPDHARPAALAALAALSAEAARDGAAVSAALLP